ncbi:hypothetical protein [Stappia stellulata]|uniref:hypothetical protein n=1 Tax=Stappia stellulata TaxID=71235 RepID=UPI0004266E55|nr:hypothetical protein [Stappia stellulata]
MLVVLGACLAGLVALAILPAIWRRAVRLTRQAVEATSPMTHADVRAEIGSLRAGHALEHRRLESGLERLQAETASNRIARDRAENVANDLRKEMLARDQALAEASAREDGLRRELQQHEEAVAMAKARQRELERSLKRMMATAGDSAEKALAPPEAPADWHSDTNASVARTSDLARIAGLESEITALKRKLEAAEKKVRERPLPQDAPDAAPQEGRGPQQRFGHQNNRLFEAESKLIAAQAEITRLSILLEEDGETASPQETSSLPGSATETAALSRLVADAERLEAENARLRADLHSNDAFMSLRRELSDLAASVMESLDTDENGVDADTLETTGHVTPDAPPATADDTRPAQGAVKSDGAEAPPKGEDTDGQPSLSARIRAARKRLKPKNGMPGKPAAEVGSTAKQKAEV